MFGDHLKSIHIPENLKKELGSLDILDGEKINIGDATLNLAENWGQKIEFYHIPTDTTIVFKAFINDYSDQFQSDWQSEDVYGRMDPIVQYQGTKRNISLDWKLPAFSREEAKLNQRKCDTLFRMLYPLYDKTTGISNAMTISTAPLFKLRFGNLIVDASKSAKNSSSSDAGSAKESGLIGTISGFTYKPDFDEGIIFDKGGSDSAHGPSGIGMMFPKSLSLSMEYTVLHAHRPGSLPFYDGSEASGKSQANPNDEASGGTSGDMDEARQASEDEFWI